MYCTFSDHLSNRMSLNAFGSVAIAVGGLATLFLLPPLLAALRSRSWTSTPGTIVSAHVDTQMRGGKEFFKPIVTYVFEVRGTRYVGERVYYGQFSHSQSPLPANEVLADYTPGMPVTVYYHPAKPSRALLRPGVHGRLFRWTIASLGIVVSGVILSIA